MVCLDLYPCVAGHRSYVAGVREIGGALEVMVGFGNCP